MKQKITLNLVLSVFLFFYCGCKKDNLPHDEIAAIANTENFFQLPADASVQLQAVAFREVKDLIERITAAIDNNPNTPIGDIIF